jgi:arylsulfatase A-like enzyme
MTRARFSLGLALSSLVLCAVVAAQAATPARPNVLFIMADDLNHWVGYLGRNQQTKTPNIDRLAAAGMSFTRSYCAAPVCNPSRAALFSGRRPGATGVYGNGHDWRTVVPSEETLITTLRRGGYTLLAAGKIYHEAFNRREDYDDYHRPPPLGAARGQTTRPPDAFNQVVFAPLAGGDDALPDYHAASYAIAQLGRAHAKPFFLAVGFHKPHPPFIVPQKYFDLHPLESIALPPFRADDLDDLPDAGKRSGIGQGTHAMITQAGKWKEAVQAYLASISYADAQIGRVLDALEKSAHGDNTIVVLLGDHGWQLGEKHHWGKTTLWEEVARAPLIWKVPGLTTPGSVCARTVDFMTIYPTLTDLCGVPTPAHVEGRGIRSLLENPQAAWPHPGITTYGQGQHAVRTERWRYIRYADGTEELYDDDQDPYEWTNLAPRPEFAATVKELAAFLPKENKPAIALSAGGAEDGEPPEARKARRAKKSKL